MNKELPEGALVCNFPKPGELMQHSEVETFFHEFGHLLHEIFAGRQQWAGVSGIRTEWDFVEVPSMLLQEWPLDATVLKTFAEWNPVSSVTQAARELFGNIPPGTPEPTVWPLQHPVVYTLIWSAMMVAVFAPLSIRQYKRANKK